MLKLFVTAVVLGLMAGAACAETLIVDEYHHATAPVKATGNVRHQRQATKPRIDGKVYLLENRRAGAVDTGNAMRANETKHNADNW